MSEIKVGDKVREKESTAIGTVTFAGKRDGLGYAVEVKWPDGTAHVYWDGLFASRLASGAVILVSSPAPAVPEGPMGKRWNPQPGQRWAWRNSNPLVIVEWSHGPNWKIRWEGTGNAATMAFGDDQDHWTRLPDVEAPKVEPKPAPQPPKPWKQDKERSMPVGPLGMDTRNKRWAEESADRRASALASLAGNLVTDRVPTKGRDY